MSKKILVVCGNGIASSSIIVSILDDYFKDQGIQDVDVQKDSLMNCTADKFNSFDLIVSSTKLNTPGITTKVILGVPLLTGIGEDEAFDDIKKTIQV